ncbi:NACHT, LRR and PYD domains-containing protein 3-like isoform X2 [Alosa pseudoharengus]|uniref:NACHT, LRR and PYD domains-containing protein 3-like isoform X2 n=1 Tax=Alosa pseudoharengus TaxID=34774 RepID=UPI003F89F728
MEGPGPSPEAVNVSISADGGTQVSAPVLSHLHVRGNVNISTHISGVQQPAQDCDQQSKITEYKTSILTSCETVKEYNSLPGQDVLLADRYTELLIIQRLRVPKEREEELRSRGETLQEVFHTRAREKNSRIHLDQLFKPSDRGSVQRAVILQGHSGHGKSFTVQKIMYDWASELLFKDFILVFHLNCKELNLLSGEHSVVDLLKCDQEFTPVILRILRDSPGKVLFVIDGFDELRFSLNEITSVLPSDPSVPAPIEATLTALLKGDVLRQGLLLVTTRSTVSDKLSEVLKTPHRFTEILGFSEDGVKEYFQRFFDDTVLSDKAYEYVRANETLITSCVIPVICWIVCTVFREHFQESVDAHGDFETTSSIFVYFINTLMKDHCEGLRRSGLTSLRSLAQLAETGIQNHQVLFDERKVSELLKDFNVRNPFLCKFLMKRKVYRETMYSFMHLSFQEFFAALHFFLIEDEEEACRKLQILLKSTADKVNSFRLIEENWRDRVVQFLFGLSSSDVFAFVNSASWAAIQAQLKEWLMNVIQIEKYGIRNSSDPRAMLFILHCLYEIHEKDFVMHVIESLEWISFSTHDLQRTDYWVLLYCLQCCQSVRGLHLDSLTAENLRMLGPGLCKCKELGLKVNLSDAYVDDLISALGEKKIIHELRIESSLSAESVEHILRALHKQKSVGWISLCGVKAVSLNIAAMSVHLIQTTAKLKSNCLWIGEDYKTPRQKDSFCLFVSVSKNVKNLSLTLGWRPATDNSDLSLVLTLTLPNMDIINLKEYLQKCHDLHENPPANDERVDVPHSSLPSDTDLKHQILKQRVRCLTLGQTLGRLSLQTFLNLKNVTISDLKLGIECSALSFERANSCRMDSIISFGPKSSDSYVSIRLSASSDMTTRDFTDFILTFDAYVMGRSGMNHADGGVDAPLSSLCSVPGLKRVKVKVNSMTLSLAAGSLCLIQTHSSVEEIKIVRFLPSTSTEQISYHCSSLCFTKDPSTQSLDIGIATENHYAAVPHMSLFLSRSSVKSFDLKDFLLKFHSLEHLDEPSPQLDGHDDALMSLHSLPGLREMKLEVGSLTVRWAKRILSLIHSCTTLQKLHVYATGWRWTRSGLIPAGSFLTKESIRLLQMAPKRPDCTLILHGTWCHNATWQCRTAKYRHRKCNQMVEISIKENSSRMKTTFKMSWKGMTINVRRRKKRAGRRDGQSEEHDCSDEEGEEDK